MKVADLQRIQEVDGRIQALLDELAQLYQVRAKAFGADAASERPARAQRRVASASKRQLPDTIDLAAFDLSLGD